MNYNELDSAAMNKKLREVKGRYFVDLLRHPGVVMVGLGSSYLRIYLDYSVEGANEKSLPQVLDGVPVRIIPYTVPKEVK